MASRGRVNSIPAFLLCLSLLCSCSRPTGGEEFLPGLRNSYDFHIEVADTLALYDFSFYTRVDKAGKEAIGPREPLRLGIVWKEPSDSTYRETVWLQPEYFEGTVSTYRTGVRFPSAGEWVLSVSVTPQPRGFRGLGLVWDYCYGTR